MERFFEAAIAACREAAALLEGPLDDTILSKTEWTGAGGDRSSGIDLALERIFVDALAPYGVIESEESGILGEGEGRIILDPLDGSSNALSRFPYYGVSIARLDEAGILKQALVANLANGDLFLVEEGGEALQGHLVREGFSAPRSAPHPEIGLFEKAYAQPGIVAALDRVGLKFRAPGAVALSLAYARSVNYFLFVGPFRIYAFAAGLALCRGMEMVVEEEYVIVARDREILERIEGLVLRERELQKE
jgi:myo-inositol-1(or 4)-monophosphatase